MAVPGKVVNRGRRVVVVEDEHLLSWGVCKDLKRWGYDPVAVGTLEAARQALGDAVPWAVLLDIRLPDGRGLELLSSVPGERLGQVVVMSAFAEMSTVVEAMRLGATDFLAKPFEPEQLQEALSRLLVRERLEAGEEPTDAPEQCGLGIVAKSLEMQRAFQRVRHFAQTPRSTVLVLGETGVGKTLVARAIHRMSRRKDGEFVAVNCAAIPPNLLESELFGHARGAFTDAHAAKKGLLELADGGTLLLDEIGDMPLEMQAKILSFIETGMFRRLGATRECRSDVRIITATHRDLQALVLEGRFREDLYYRLKVLTVEIPPLRNRREDVWPLVDAYLQRFADEMGVPVPRPSNEVIALLRQQAWPGNVREMIHVLEAAMALCGGGARILPNHLPHDLPGVAELAGSRQKLELEPSAPGAVEPPRPPVPKPPEDAPTIRIRLDGSIGLADIDREVLGQAMALCDGNQVRAAALLKVSRHLLRYRLKKHGLLG